MAEGLLRSLSKGGVESFSAGSAPTSVHPLAVEVMGDVGIDISMQSSKHLDTFRSERFDYVITVCDRVKESCPTWPDAIEHIHWKFDDPANVTHPTEARRMFVSVRNEIASRVRLFLLSHRFVVDGIAS
jgi:arsenate reductase